MYICLILFVWIFWSIGIWRRKIIAIHAPRQQWFTIEWIKLFCFFLFLETEGRNCEDLVPHFQKMRFGKHPWSHGKPVVMFVTLRTAQGVHSRDHIPSRWASSGASPGCSTTEKNYRQNPKSHQFYDFVGISLGRACKGGRIRRDSQRSMMTRWWFQTFFIFTPKIGEIIQFDEYFSNGLKPPTRKRFYFSWFCSMQFFLKHQQSYKPSCLACVSVTRFKEKVVWDIQGHHTCICGWPYQDVIRGCHNIFWGNWWLPILPSWKLTSAPFRNLLSSQHGPTRSTLTGPTWNDPIFFFNQTDHNTFLGVMPSPYPYIRLEKLLCIMCTLCVAGFLSTLFSNYATSLATAPPEKKLTKVWEKKN